MALIGAPGEAHSLEMRQEFFDKNARMRSDSVEFAIVLLSNGQLIGLGGLFDISRASTATLFVGIGERDQWGKGLARRRRASFANMASSFEISTASKCRSTATIEGRSTSTSVSDSSS
jgi:Acetyltransferase (GNAT) domain